VDNRLDVQKPFVTLFIYLETNLVPRGRFSSGQHREHDTDRICALEMGVSQ